MDQNVLIGAIVVIALVVVIAIYMAMQRRKTDHLRDRFGDEYDRAIEGVGDRGKAEAALAEREKRVDALTIRSLTASEHGRFADEWREVKAVFVDSPVEAVLRADRLVATMMKTVGYPMADFDRRYEDLTVDHADVARHYREGHAVIERNNGADAGTEDMRQAMKHYEALFDHLASGADRDAVADTAPIHREPVGAATTATDIGGDGDADILRQDRDRDGTRESVIVDRK